MSKDSGALWLKAKRTFEILPRLGYISMFESEFTCNELSSRAENGVAFRFEIGQRILVHLAVTNDFGRQVAFCCEQVARIEGRQFADFRGGYVAAGRTSGLHMIDHGCRDRGRIFPDFVFITVAVLTNVIGENRAAVPEMDGIGPAAGRRLRQTKTE